MTGYLCSKEILSSSTPIRRSVLFQKEETNDEITNSKIGNSQFDTDITHWYFLSFHLSLLRDRIAWFENDTLRLYHLKQKKNIRFTLNLISVFRLIRQNHQLFSFEIVQEINFLKYYPSNSLSWINFHTCNTEKTLSRTSLLLLRAFASTPDEEMNPWRFTIHRNRVRWLPQILFVR